MRNGFRTIALATVATLALCLAACSGSAKPGPQWSNGASQPPIAATSNLPLYPPTPTSGTLAVADFANVKGCLHPCTAPVRVAPGNSSPNMVDGWPCEDYVAIGHGFCIDAAKAKQKVRDQILIVCRKLGNADRQDGNLSDDRGNPTRDWFQVVIPKDVAARITYPTKPPLASDGTYRGYISGAWLRKTGDPLGTLAFDVTAPDC